MRSAIAARDIREPRQPLRSGDRQLDAPVSAPAKTPAQRPAEARSNVQSSYSVTWRRTDKDVRSRGVRQTKLPSPPGLKKSDGSATDCIPSACITVTASAFKQQEGLSYIRFVTVSRSDKTPAQSGLKGPPSYPARHIPGRRPYKRSCSAYHDVIRWRLRNADWQVPANKTSKAQSGVNRALTTP